MCWLVSPLIFPSINICCTKANRNESDWKILQGIFYIWSVIFFFCFGSHDPYSVSLMFLLRLCFCCFLFKYCCFSECFLTFFLPLCSFKSLPLFPNLHQHSIFFKLFAFLSTSSMHIYVAVTNRSPLCIEFIYQICFILLYIKYYLLLDIMHIQ